MASTGVRLVLTDRDHAAAARELTRADVVIVEMDEGRRSQVPPVDRIDPASPAYVYFTSGSTGAPKGVMDTHRNVLHNVFRYTATLGFGPADRMSLIQSPSVSAVVSTQFGALCNGAALCPVPVAGSEPGQVTTALADAGATIFHTVPALFHYLADFGLGAVASLRLIRLEGDRAVRSDVDRLRSDFAEDVILVNGLGATECGLVSQFFVLPGQQVAPGVLPVGHAVPDVEVLVQDAGGALATGGAEGEVVIRSAFLAR